MVVRLFIFLVGLLGSALVGGTAVEPKKARIRFPQFLTRNAAREFADKFNRQNTLGRCHSSTQRCRFQKIVVRDFETTRNGYQVELKWRERPCGRNSKCPPGPFGYCVPSSVPPSDPSRKFSKFADCTVKSWNGVPLEQPVCDKGDEGDEGDEGRVGDEGDEDIKVGGALEEA